MAAAILAPFAASAAPRGSVLDPADYASPGALKVESGSLTFDTGATPPTVSGAFASAGVVARSESGRTEIAAFCFDTIAIGKGVAITVTGSRPLALLSKSDATIASPIDVSGEAGRMDTTAPGTFAAAGRAGGFSGGRVSVETSDAANGPGRASFGAAIVVAGGGAGHFGEGGKGGVTNSPAKAGAPYGSPTLSELQGGSGGSGARRATDGAVVAATNGSGGAGGGALEISAAGAVTIDAPIGANGGAGGDANGTGSAGPPEGRWPAGGGGGSGGAILIAADRIVNNSTLSAEGGRGGDTNSGQGVSSQRGGGGGAGGYVTLYYRTSKTQGAISVAGGRGGTSAKGGEYVGQPGSAGKIHFPKLTNAAKSNDGFRLK